VLFLVDGQIIDDLDAPSTSTIFDRVRTLGSTS
jgi:hypothetical protein